MAHDSYRLEDIALDHPIGAGIFVPFTVARLAPHGDATEAVLRVRMLDIATRGESERQLRLHWSPESAPAASLAVQGRTVTEWAACGIACAVIGVYTGRRVRSVAAAGDRFDYWVDDGEQEYGLEVSGTTTEDVDARHRAKLRQLRDNPYAVDGYVVVAGFATREVILAFHWFEEEI